MVDQQCGETGGSSGTNDECCIAGSSEFVKLKQLHRVAEVIRHRHDVNSSLNELFCKRNVWFRARQDHDRTLQHLVRFCYVNGNPIVSIQRGELLCLEPIRIGDRKTCSTE
jgi:CTP synthase (UTP-ammonia lyase)